VRSLLKFLMCAAAFLLPIALFAVLMIEWIAGCGETYVDAEGERHAYECVFIPQPEKDGK